VLGIIVALPQEGRALFGWRHWHYEKGRPVFRSASNHGTEMVCICSGMGYAKAFAAVSQLIDEGATILGAVGVAGGLHPALKSGDLIIADQVFTAEALHGQSGWRTSRRCRRLFQGMLTQKNDWVFTGSIATAFKPVLTSAAKRALNHVTGALAVDMESSALACRSLQTGRPFFVVRAVCDTAARDVSADLFHCMDANGRMRPLYILSKLLERPLFAMELIGMQKSFAAALSTLKRCGKSINCSSDLHLNLC
jgi:adenosylhomocysteine nucleosidase